MIYENQSGRTMTEMLAVLAIMGIIIYGVVSGINYGMASYRVNRLYVEIPNIINGIQDMYLAVFGRNTFPDFACNTKEYDSSKDCADQGLSGSSKTNCQKCEILVKNDILTRDIHNLAIQLASDTGQVIITLDAGNQDVCQRLAQMDWIGQSISCKDGDIGCNVCTKNNNCCSKSPYHLTFSSK